MSRGFESHPAHHFLVNKDNIMAIALLIISSIFLLLAVYTRKKIGYAQHAGVILISRAYFGFNIIGGAALMMPPPFNVILLIFLVIVFLIVFSLT